ncbi:PREDICTED: gasdermin-C isoform X2 [Chinchilla lanigera]|uniref:Uncharacterized protein n=1 Tax=Chinchilla lanigera TaxID=34839 RepID=A0A8C2UKB2_CHILA|nr:PREDICTED: gasdermin-C isoform X2 [Chinchilla lanigera]
MSNIFERASKNMIKRLGGKDMRPVTCALDANKFRQFSIILKRSRFLIGEGPDDIPVGYSLMQILEPSSSVPDSVISGPLSTVDFEVKKLTADVGINVGVEVSVSGGVTRSHGSTLEIQSVSIPNCNLEILQNRKLLDQEPSFLSICRRRGDNLYVVTEAVELTKDTVLCDNSSVALSGKVSIPQVTSVKGEGQGQGQRETTMRVLQGTVMAYRKKKLVIKDKYCSVLVIDDTKQRTFQYEQPTLRSAEMTKHHFQCSPRSICVEAPEELRREIYKMEFSPILPIGFRLLEEEVSENVKALAWVSKDGRDVMFHSILAMLADREALQKLMDMLEMENFSHLDGPGGKILDELRQGSSPPWINLENLIFYLLEVLLVLSDAQFVLLVQSVEKRILFQQRELVRSILEPNFKYPWHIPFTLPAELLSPLQGEGLRITYALLEGCGLEMELGSPRSTWHLEAKMPLSALYAALSLLLQLAKDWQRVSPGPGPAHSVRTLGRPGRSRCSHFLPGTLIHVETGVGRDLRECSRVMEMLR